MKLLAITSYYKPAYVYGGPVSCQSSLYESLVKFGVDVLVVTTNANGSKKLDVPLFKTLDVDGVQVIYCPSRQFRGSAFFSPTLIQEAKRLIPIVDIVHLQTFWGYATRPLTHHCIKHHIPFFVSLDGQLMDYGMRRVSWMKRLKKLIFLNLVGYQHLNAAAALHCSSTLEISHLQALPIHSPTFLIPNSIDINSYKTLPQRGQFREIFHIPENALVMVLVGRLAPVKNPHIAVAALIAAQGLSTPVHLLVVGPDEHSLQSSLEEQARRAGCMDRLHFTGLLSKESVIQAFVDSDLFIMPSESENFGMSAAESMASGLPILVSEKVPVGEWAKQAHAGEIASLDATSFSDTAIAMLTDSAKLKIMGMNGKAAAKKLFNAEYQAKKMFNYLQQIIQESKKNVRFI